MDHRAIAAVFDRCFRASHRTVLLGGFSEPYYQPGEPLNELRYREDFAASALHEAAHWLTAGATRRRLPDFGYWYQPDGRDPEQQARFERFEARNQALEWILCEAAGIPFRPSIDNLAGGGSDEARFTRRIQAERRRLDLRGLPPRAARFGQALAGAAKRLNRPGAPRGWR